MLAHFTIRLLCGVALMLAAMPRRDVASAFFKIMLRLILGLAVLLALATDGPRLGPIVLAVLAFFGSALWTLELSRPGSAVIILLAGVSLEELWRGTVLFRGTAATAPLALHLAADLDGAAVLGATMTGMLLGHRYLTAPGMPLAPLLRINTLLGGAALLRAVLSAAVWFEAGATPVGETDWIWLGLRWTAGILGPAVACLMVWRILKYRNTQSATGVLFVGVIVAFIGELAADLLYHDLHLPL